jgi:HK97 gp10 family phage protein
MPAIVGGMARLQAQLEALELEFTPQDLQAGALVIIDRAQQLVPVDTGFLYNSAFVQVGSEDVLFGFNAEYASYVEFGTYKMAAQPYLRPAIDDAEQDALNAIMVSIQSHWEQSGSAFETTGQQVNTQGGGPGTLQP